MTALSGLQGRSRTEPAAPGICQAHESHTHSHTRLQADAGWLSHRKCKYTSSQFSFVVASPHFSCSIISLPPLGFSSISPPFTRGNGCLRSVSKLLEACYCWWQMNDIGIEASQAQGEPLSNGNRSRERERERERSQHNEKAIYFSNKDKCATLISVWLI